MGRGANKFFLLALLLSLAAHAVVASLGQTYLSLPGFAVEPPAREPEMIVRLTEDDPPVPEQPELDPEPRLGDPSGVGYASFASDGVREQLARLAENDQAAMSLDPRGEGTGGDSIRRPAEWQTEAHPSAARVAEGQPMDAPPPPTPLVGVAAAAVIPPKRHAPAVASARPAAPTPEREPERPSKSPMTVVASSAEPVATADAAQVQRVAAPRPPSPPAQQQQQQQQQQQASVADAVSQAADPARQSDGEVDPFSSLGSVEFREGNLAVRAGRQVKARRPKLMLAGKVSLATMQRARVVLSVSTDATGRVTSTEIVKSSGSIDIDQPTRVAMYDWWFEPKLDAAGQPVPDRFRFEIVFN